MPKKFGINSKAAEARGRKAAFEEQKNKKQAEEQERREQKLWDEGSKKNARKEREEAHRVEKLAKKKERQMIEAEETAELAKYKPPKVSLAVTKTSSEKSNVSISDGSSLPEEFSASNIDDALTLLTLASAKAEQHKLERHPERRVKAAFAVFEKRELSLLRAEHPDLRHSQLREMLNKMWQKSPDNPFNQTHVPHDVTREEELEIIKSKTESDLSRLRIT